MTHWTAGPTGFGTRPRHAAPIDRFQRRCGVVLLAGIGLLLLLLGARLVYINTSLRDRLLAIAERQQHGSSVIPARRGMILDSRGRVVAASRHMPDVFVDPSRVEDVDALARELGPRVNIPAGRIADAIHARPGSRFVVVASRVDEVTADAVRALRSPAVGLEDRAVRDYPLGDSMKHVLGLVGRDGYGLEGIELAYDEHLRGHDGRRETIRDARRRVLRQSEQARRASIDGGHVVLTIDAEVQRITEAVLADRVVSFEAESGVAIVISPTNGEILAMASIRLGDIASNPSTHDTHPVPPADGAPGRNRAVTDPTEPGSAFKPIIACGALDGGFVSPTEKIDCRMGRTRFGRRVVTDVKPYGLLDIKGILTRSSNIGMGIIAQRMGNGVLYDTIRRFGFGERTGIDYPGESGGLVYPLHRWTSYSTTSVCMGYEVAVTPLQLVNAFAAIVNDGVLLRPRMVKRLLGPDGRVVRSFDSPRIVRRVASSATAQYMTRELLVSVVESGSGGGAQVGPHKVLGKTGTAKLPYPDRRGYEPGAYSSTFVGAAPAGDPKAVVLVVIRRPDPAIGYYGSTVAAPVVGKILAATLAYLGVPPDEQVALVGL